MSSVFLSHSHADKLFARQLAADLRVAGHTVWIDEAEINIGDSLVAKIREGIDEVDFVAAIISSTSVSSEWVTRELDLASNREMREKRVVVLPLLVERVALPGFLDGKLYGDFCSPAAYAESFAKLLRALGPAKPLPKPDSGELEQLREQLAEAQAAAARHDSAARAHETLALKGKSARLIEAIKAANAKYPQHAPINNVYAFEVGSMPMTLDYLFWCIAKAERRGGHPMDVLISIEEKWGDVKSMLDAYSDVLAAADDKPLTQNADPAPRRSAGPAGRPHDGPNSWISTADRQAQVTLSCPKCNNHVEIVQAWTAGGINDYGGWVLQCAECSETFPFRLGRDINDSRIMRGAIVLDVWDDETGDKEEVLKRHSLPSV